MGRLLGQKQQPILSSRSPHFQSHAELTKPNIEKWQGFTYTLCDRVVLGFAPPTVLTPKITMPAEETLLSAIQSSFYCTYSAGAGKSVLNFNILLHLTGYFKLSLHLINPRSCL